MKHTFKPLAIALAILNSPFSSLNSSAAVPVEWSCDIDSGSPRAVAAYRGETLLLKCTFTRRGAPISAPAAAATLYWQTNGMAAAWWSTNAAVSGASVSAPFTPAMDPGADQCTFFFAVVDADGASYRANGRIRFAPSPGVSPNTLMPEPGATINFTGATIVGAPWATLEQIDATLGAYATTQALDEVRALMPDVSPFATTSQVAAVAASIPSLSGYATEAYVQSAVSNIPAPDLSVYASRAYADAAASNAQANAISRIPSLSGYATQSYVQNAITNISAPSLDGYASKAYADAAASNAQANAVSRIPSLSGYATETYVQNAITNISAPSLDGYATRAYADAAASNAQANAIARIPPLSGYATETYVQNAITNISIPSLDGYASKAYADAAASNAQANAVSRIPSLSGYATETYVQNAITNISIPSLDGYASKAYADAAASNVAATAAATYLTGVPDYYATKSYVMDQVQTGGGRYSAGVWSDGYVLDATGVVYTATIITNSIPTPPYATNTTTYIEGGVTTTVETVTTNYTYEVVTNLAPAFKTFLADAATGPDRAVAAIAVQSALQAPVLYLADDGRIFNRIRDGLYLCQDGSYLDYGYPYYDTEIWRYGPAGGDYVFCYDAQDRPATNPAPPSVIKWGDSGVPAGSATLKTVLSAFPLYASKADIAPATNNLRSIEARVDIIEEALDREWNRPGEWELRYSASPISPVLSRFAVVTNDETGVIVSNATVTETQSLAANIYSYPLDELSMSPAPTVTLSCNDAGASLSGSVLTVNTNGVYTVRGTSPDGVTRSVQVPMYVTTLTDQHKSTYIADTNGSARAVVNDTMRTVLEAADYYEHPTLDYPTDRGANPPGQFTGWRTITPTWAWPGVGNYNPWAIAPKVLVSASHWIRRPSNPIQLYDSVGGTNFFVSVGYWEHLDTWARTNGFTDAESRAADRADICLGGIVEGYVPDACIPYLADAAELDALFGGTIDGVMAWHYPRGTTEDTCGTTEQAGNLYTWCIPVLLNVDGPTADTPIRWTGPAYMTDANDTNVRADILALIGKYDANNWWRVRGGDSGRPVFIRWGQYDIPVAETHRTTMGGSIPAAAAIIRAFCTQHGCTPKSLPH